MAEKTGWFRKMTDYLFSFPGQTEEAKHPPFKTSHIILTILLFAFLLRVPFLLFPEVIHNDGTEYIHHAKEVITGNWTGGKSGPLYPVLIAFAKLFAGNFELAGIWVSVILGSLLILPVFYLGRTIFNEKVGVISALLAAVQPFLYVYSGSVLTESTYYFLLTASVFYGWKAFQRGKPWDIVLVALFSALAYLTKPEAFVLIVPFCLWVLLINPFRAHRSVFKRIVLFLMVIVCFLAFSLPYLIQLRKESGRWDISKKASIVLDVSSDKLGEVPVGLGREGLKISLISFVENPLPFFETVVCGFFKSLYRFDQGYTPVLFLLAILGWVGLFRNRSSNIIKGNLFVLSYLILFFGFVFPFFWILKRYTSQMVAISLPWAAFGYLHLTGWAHQWSVTRRLNKKFFVILFLIFLACFAARGLYMHFSDHRLIQRKAGLWMKDHLPSESKMMSRLPQDAFYAERRWIGIPEEEYEKVLVTARAEGIRFLVVDENIDDRSPGFWEKINTKDLTLLKEFHDGKQKVAVFKIIYP